MQHLRDKVWYMRDADVFRDLSEHEVSRLADKALMREYGRGGVILQPGKPSDLIFIIKEGRVKVSTYSPEGREQILAILEPGDLFGEQALVGESEPAHMEALEDTLVCGVRREDFEEVLHGHPQTALRIIGALAERLRLAEEEIENLVFRDVPGRLAFALLRLGEAYGVRDPKTGSIRLTLRLTHQDLASMIGATRETVTTILTRFRDEGLTDLQDRHIVIRLPDRLRALTQPRRP
jgi:CRP/FNR family transcriptional regulator